MKKYANDSGLHEKVLSGVNKLTDNVASTMGPRGRVVILQQSGKTPIATKDGVSVARFVEFEDPFENAAAEIIKQAAEETNSSAGDGTTTATVLARAILTKAHKFIAAGHAPVEIKRGIDVAVENLVHALEESAQPISSIDDIINIATISANGDEVIGKLIGEAVASIGKDGSITIKEGGSVDTTIEIVEGFRFDSGVCSTKFITNERLNTMKHKNPLFLITDETVDQISQIYPALELAAREKKPLIIVADEIQDDALAVLIMNAVRGTLKVAAVKAPAYGEERREILSDLAVAVGATFFSQNSVDPRGISEVVLKDFGTADSIESSRRKTTIVNGNCDPDKVTDRIAFLDAEIEESNDVRECEKLQARIARLASSVAIIFVGGFTETEMIERKHRVEDALEAVRSAQVEGVVTGCGTALLRVREVLDGISIEGHPDQDAGIMVVEQACEAPLRQIILNAELSPDIIISDIETSEEDDVVYDFIEQDYVDAWEYGIIDPAKVVRCALQNAASAAGTLIMSNYAIIERE